MNNRLLLAGFLLGLALFMAACGRERAGEPTALPPDVARPQQPTPVFDNSARTFQLTPPPTISVNLTHTDTDEELTQLQSATESTSGGSGQSPFAGLMVAQPPTALGIVVGQTPLRTEPGGVSIETLFAGETVTVTGRSSDGRYLAIFTAAGGAGWVAAPSLTLYGADDLTVVEQAIGPGPVVTIIAEAMLPVESSVLDAVMTTMP